MKQRPRNGRPPRGPEGKAEAGGPTPVELALVQMCAAEVQLARPGLPQDRCIHFAAQAVKEQADFVRFLAGLNVAGKAGKPEAAWIEVTIQQAQSADLLEAAPMQTIATFAGPIRDADNAPTMQVLGAALARALCVSAQARALLYSKGLRIKARPCSAPHDPKPRLDA